MRKEPGREFGAGGGMRQRPGAPLPRQRDHAPAQNAVPTVLGEECGDPEAFHGWVKTWTWTLAGFFVYVAARWIVDACLPADPLASAELFKQVPLLVYQMSSTAFFTALVLNLTSLLFEDNATKRQLALLSCAIKGAACHTDMLLVTGRAHVLMDSFGAIVIPQRYVQWLVTTPTMVYILSKISDFTPAQTATAISLDAAMVVSGLVANFLPGPYRWLMFGFSSLLFVGVLHMMGLMVYSAVKEHTSHTSRRSLLFIYMCTLLIWTLFPVAWVFHVLNPTSPYGEYLNVFANFMAKVLFSSSIMYGNYMTIAQRRLLAQQAAENAHRVRMIQELRDAVTRKDQFMSLMSHELRTPLNGIIQLSDALVRGAGGEMNPKGQHFVKTIKNSSNHLLNIINDILDVAALKEGKLTIKHELCSLAKAVDHVVDIVAPLARKDVAIERHVDQRTPLIIADFSRVIQILYNLAGNALKFTHRGRVVVCVEPSADGRTVRLQVADTGIGIPTDRINGIWGAFEQVDMSVTRKYGGTGLGLNIVKQLVEAHEGSIDVRSEEGRGTTFTVTLPVMQANTRRSLEEQVVESLAKCGHATARDAMLKKRSQRLVSSSGRKTSLEDTLTQLARGVRRHTSGLMSPKQDGGDSVGHVSGSNSVETEDVLYRRRTQELERENLMGELQRRTEHKRSMEEAHLASRQLELSEPERQAELDSRSLECLEMQIAAGGAPAGGRAGGGIGRGVVSGLRQRSEAGMLTGRGGSFAGGSDGSFHAWRGELGPVGRVTTGRRSLTASDAREAVGAATRASGGGVTGGAATLSTTGNSLTDMYENVMPGRASDEPYTSNATLVRKLSTVSTSGAKSSTVRDALRISTYGRASGGNGAAGHGNLGTAHSGPVPVTSSHLLLKALDSDLYRTGRDSHDDGSSAGGDSESDGHRSGRRKQKAAVPPRQSKLLPNSGPLSGNGGAAAGAVAAAPPGLTLDKLAYSDMYGTVQILSVDDEEVNQIVLEEILTSSGYHFERCMDGLEALEWLCGSETMPDLILLDCMMPHMSGHEFCTTLRKAIPGNVLPVIMVSAKSDEDNIVEGLRSGSNDFVRKPYQREELLARIETQLRLKSDSWWLAELVNNVDGRETESMKLLKNILPESIIARMQQGQKFVADSHSHVVILFSDIVGFTSLSSKLPTAEVFLMLSNMFTSFDKLTDRFSVYKVETIGDAYMVAAGHDEDDDKARKGAPLMRVLGFARAMLDVVRNIKAPNGERMRIRIGVHCGPAFAGVIGMKCPRYCFLGDTVNTASRMESTGFPMCIHVSENVYKHHPNPETELVEVGEREVKGKGRMRTYLVRVGSWEQALSDYAARQQAAAVANQQQQQLLAVQAALQKQQQQQRLLQPVQTGEQCAGLEAAAGSRNGGGALSNGGVQPPPPLRVPANGSGCGSRSHGQLLLSVPSGGSDDTSPGRFVHLLSTVREDTSDGAGAAIPQRASSLTEQQAMVAAATAAVAAGSSYGGFMRLSTGSATGVRSPLSRPELSVSRLPPRSTFGSETFYFDESSEDGAASTQNGLVSACGILRSCSGSLTGLLPPSGSEPTTAAAAAASAAARGSPAAPAVRSGGGSAPSTTSTTATPGGDNVQRQRSDHLLSPAAPTGPSWDLGRACSASAGCGAMGNSAAVGVDGKYLAQMFSGHGLLSSDSASLKAGPLRTTVDYLEQRIASLGTQLAMESSKRHRLQAELDAERRRAAGALQQVMLLQHQAEAMATAAAAMAMAADQHPPSRTAAPAATGPTPGGCADSEHHPFLGSGCLGTTDGDYKGRGSVQQQPQTSSEAAQVLPPPPPPPQQQHQQEGQDMQQQQERRPCLQFGSVDSPDAEVVILGAADHSGDNDSGDTGGGLSAAAAVPNGPAVEPGVTAPPGRVAVPDCFPLLLPCPPVSSETSNDPRVDALGSGSVGGRAGSGASEMPGSPFVLTDLEWHSTTLSVEGDAATAAAPVPLPTATEAEATGCPQAGPRPPSGAAHVHVAEAGHAIATGTAAPAADSGQGSDTAARAAASGSQAVLTSPKSTQPRRHDLSSTLATKAVGIATTASSNVRRLRAGRPAILQGLFGMDLKTAVVTAAASADSDGGGDAVAVLQPSWLLPRYSLDLLFEELGLLPYLGRFQEEAIRLDQLLGMDVGQMEQLGLRPLGYCLRLREAVMDLARGLLRACEEAALLAQPPPPPAVATAAAAGGAAIYS